MNNNVIRYYRLNEYYKYLRKLKKDLLQEIQKQEKKLKNNTSNTEEKNIKKDLLYKYIALNVITIRESKDNPFTRMQRIDCNEVFPEEKHIFEFLEKLIRLSYLESYDEFLPYELELFKLKK